MARTKEAKRGQVDSDEPRIFGYSAKTAAGEKVEGFLAAGGEDDVREALAAQDLESIKVTERKQGGLRAQFAFTVKSKMPDLILFCRQLATFDRSELPIIQGLEVMAEQARTPGLRETLYRVAARVERGESLSQAMGRYPLVFPRLFTDLVRAGEQTGSLDSVLSELSVHYERELAAKRRIKQALAYPLTIVGLSIMVVIILVSYVIPQFVRLFEEFEAQLPITTRILIASTKFFSKAWPFILVAAVVFGVLGYVIFARTRGGKRLWHRIILRMPVTGKVVRASLTERYCRTLASLLEAGVPVGRAFDVVGPSMNNLVFEDKLELVKEEVIAGESLSWSLGASQLFPSMVIQMVRTGEQTGTLGSQLRYLADFYRDELNYRVDRATALLEPAVLIFVGLGVGFVAISMVSTMYGIFGSVK